MKLPVLARGRRDQPLQFQVLLSQFALRHRMRICCQTGIRRSPPPAHETQKKPRRYCSIPARSVERKEALPDDLRIDVPAGERRFRSLDKVGPGRSVDVGPSINFDPSCKDSFVLRISR